MKKVVQTGIIVISYALVLFALFLDVFTSISMSGIGKIFFYGVPMLLLFGEMIYEIKAETKKEEREKIKKKRLWAIFIIYLIALMTLLFMPSSFRYYNTWQSQIPLFSQENLQSNLNIVPFKTIFSYSERLGNHSINLSIVITNLLGNLVAFAPFGFFVPLLMKDKIKNIGMFFFMVIGIVLIVEVLQFFLRVGSADIDDLILNTLGAIIVYGIMQMKIVKKGIDKLLN